MECKENHKKFSLAFKSKANMTNGNDIADDNDIAMILLMITTHLTILHTLACINVSLILVPQKYLFHQLDQEYCLDTCQFVKYQSCKIASGFRFFVCVEG